MHIACLLETEENKKEKWERSALEKKEEWRWVSITWQSDDHKTDMDRMRSDNTSKFEQKANFASIVEQMPG